MVATDNDGGHGRGQGTAATPAAAARAWARPLPSVLVLSALAATCSLVRARYAGGAVAVAASTASAKVGLCCEGCNATQYAPFANVASWAYRYSLFVDDPVAAAWMAANNVEFVAHLAHHHVPLPTTAPAACNFDHAQAATPLCTEAMLDGALAYAKRQAPVAHLMGWNEAYDDNNKKAAKKYITPADAATWWRVHVQGMAARANLSLVSPTTGAEKHKLEWFGDMLLECWAQRGLGCDVGTVAAFSVHDYKCSEEYWVATYGDQGTFQSGLVAYLIANGTSGVNWAAYVHSRPIWVTETNCNGDTGFPPTAPVSGPEQCARISGQRASAPCGEYGQCGKGSLAAMEAMATVARVSWWNTWQDNAGGDVKTANAMLVDGAGTLNPRVSPVPALAPLGVHAACTEPLTCALSHFLPLSIARAKACVCVNLTPLHDWCVVFQARSLHRVVRW